MLNGTAVVSAGCTFLGSSTVSGLMSRSVNSQLLAIACMPYANGQAIVATDPKTILTVGYDARMTVAAYMTSYLNTGGTLVSGGLAASVTSIVTDDGSNFFFSSPSGVLWSPGGGVVTRGQHASTTARTGLAWPDKQWVSGRSRQAVQQLESVPRLCLLIQDTCGEKFFGAFKLSTP